MSRPKKIWTPCNVTLTASRMMSHSARARPKSEMTYWKSFDAKLKPGELLRWRTKRYKVGFRL